MVNRIHSPNPAGSLRGPQSPGRPAPKATTPFSDVFEKELQASRAVRFSAHALKRLESRHVRLSDGDQARIEQAVDKAAAKGSRETLLLMERVALVVSVPNRTVITVVPEEEMEDNVFTNIDSAVVISANDADAAQKQPTRPDPLRGSLHAAERQTRLL